MKTELLLHPETERELDTYLEKPSQTLLLAGKTGTGKSLLARELSAALLKVDVGKLDNTPGFRFISPVDGSIKIEIVRSLAHFVQLVTPGHDRIARIICVEDADAMTREAQNALLKLLEEPPERTVFILTSSQPRLLLPTVISRLQKIRIRMPAAGDIATAFAKQGYNIPAVEKAQLQAAGNMARLAELLSGDAQTGPDVIALAKQLLSSDQFIRLATINNELKDKDVSREVVGMLVTIALTSLKTASGAQLKRWQKVLESAHIAQTNLERNGNQKIVLTELMLSM